MAEDHRQSPPQYDPKDFTTEPYVKRVNKPWGYELHWVRESSPYMGKIEHIYEGAILSLQVHDQKQESYFLLSGRAMLIWENNRGEMVETELQRGFGYGVVIGQKHRLKAITECEIVEASTPELGTTWRLEDAYGRPDETPEQRKIDRDEA